MSQNICQAICQKFCQTACQNIYQSIRQIIYQNRLCARARNLPPFLPFVLPFALPLVLLTVLLQLPSLAHAYSFDPTPLKARATRLLDSGELLECVDVWNMVRTYSPRPEDRAEALVRMGDVYSLFLDQPDEALAAYGAAMKVHPALPVLENGYFNAGMILYEQGRVDEARETFRTYLLRYPHASRRETALFMLDRMASESGFPQGTERGSTPQFSGKEPVVRVAVARASDLVFRSSSAVNVQIRDQASNARQGGLVLPAGENRCYVRGSSLVLGGRTMGKSVTLTIPAGQRVKFDASPAVYGGTIVLLVEGEQVVAVNHLRMEEYLQGVVPAEMPSSFSSAALQAQAVAARSYALYLTMRSAGKAYDVAADTGFQVYGGMNAGTVQTRAAVSSTRGRVLQFDGRLVLSYFHAHSGGMLEDDRQVWTADMPYYRVQHDEISNRARDMRWSLSLTGEDIAARMRDYGFSVSDVTSVRVGQRTASGRVGTVVVETADRAVSSPGGSSSELSLSESLVAGASSGRIVEMKGNAFRLMLGAERMRSTLCDLEWQGNSLAISGAGYGHGVGMSQWGAQGMALGGASCEQILEHYYPDTRLVRAY
ncbi:SpoIID/LytB domain-containing protein [Desulfovibrio subterraneus]|uniref:SpoIID/LytB domain-containing protein n=1 Tax=Desulfovibrio subterraneus TaxID=2718620 RepID=UPI0022B8A57D|nr:SpoIID/LytB domain-containing protein [Desulfovibrio subterraneus]WBF68301.1 SpoIID/LytB domain-containing protein [Desulfovibrio subterraneus]